MTRIEAQELTDPSGRGFIRAGWLDRLRPDPLLDVELVRSAGGIGICLLLATLLSYLRIWLAGTVKADTAGPADFQIAWIKAAVGICLVVAGGLHVRVCWAGARTNWRLLLAAAVAIQLAAAPALPTTSNDIFSNLANGRLVLTGSNPYVESPQDLGSHDPFRALVDARWHGSRTPYGPIAVDVSALAAMARSPWAALVAFKAALLACSLGCVLIAYRFCSDCLPAGNAEVSFILLAWNPLLAWEISGQAHNDGLMLLGTAAFVWAATASRRWLAWLVLSLAFCAKIAVVPVVGLYLVVQARRSFMRAIAMLATGGVVVCMLYAPFWHGSASLQGILQSADVRPDRLTNSLLALLCGTNGLVGPEWRPFVVHAWLIAARLGCAVLAAALAWRATTFPGVLADSVVFILVYQCLAMGWLLPWYATWLVPLAVGCRHVGLQRTIAVYCALAPLDYLPASGLVVGLVVVPLTPLVMLACDRSWLKRSPPC